jgi:uncharacterized protein (DUF1330 family)
MNGRAMALWFAEEREKFDECLRDRTAQDDRSRGLYRYQAQFFDVFKKYSGRLLSADENPSVLERTWNCDKLVLMSFPDEAAFHAWASSPDYLDIAKDRKFGAQAVVLLAKGFAPQRDSD